MHLHVRSLWRSVLPWGLIFGFVLPLPPALSAADPVHRAHAHNDYEHKRPLFDALDQGFTSVEADVFLEGNRLLVGHTREAALKRNKTLEELYLDPLAKLIEKNGGAIYRKGEPFYLLIDVKSAAKPTYSRLNEVLRQYPVTRVDRDYAKLSRFVLPEEIRNGVLISAPITIVVSGERDFEYMKAQKLRCAGYDGRKKDIDVPGSEVSRNLMPWISDRWGLLFKWTGNGPMPPDELKKLREFVRKAHASGRMVRFWGTPEKEEVWRVLYDEGVDLINTDKLAELSAFLRAQQKK